MADNQIVSPTASYTAATDDVGGNHYQYVKLADGTLDSSLPVPYDANRGFIVNTGKSVRIAVTPTISTSIYASGDAVGGLLTFANAARFSGGGGVLLGVTIIDKDQEQVPFDLVLFDRTFTASADNAVFAPSDADLANVICSVDISTYTNFSTNAIAVAQTQFPFVANGTSLFGQLVVSSTPTYTATTDITVILNILQE